MTESDAFQKWQSDFQRRFSGLHFLKGWEILIPMTTSNHSHTEKKVNGKKKCELIIFFKKKDNLFEASL